MTAEQAFIEALGRAGYSQVTSRTQPWMRKSVAKEWARGGEWQCIYCGRAIGDERMVTECPEVAKWAIDHLVPVAVGGPDLGLNLVPACDRCNIQKGSSDWLLFGKAVDKERVMRARLEVFAHTPNHLIRNPLLEGWTRLKVARVLETRREHPRTVIFAACPPGDYGYIGLRAGMKCGIEVQAVLAGCVALPCRVHRAWRVSRSRWLDVVWQLIALNSLMLRLDLGAEWPDATPADNADDARWAETYRSLTEIVYRRARIYRPWSPKNPGPPLPASERAGGPPTRPGGKLPRRPNGEGRRAQRNARLREKLIRRLEDIPVYKPPGPAERAFITQRRAAGITQACDDALMRLAVRRLAYEWTHGKAMPITEWSRWRDIKRDMKPRRARRRASG